MIGYLYIALAMVAGATKGYCGKRVSSHLVGNSDAALTSFVRMIICTLVGFVLAALQTGEILPYADTMALVSALISGVATAFFIISWIISIRSGSFVMVDVFLTLGVGVTLVLSAMLGERVRLTQILGFALLVVAAYIMCSYNKTLNGKMSLKSLLLLIICGASSGTADFAQKLFNHTSKGTGVAAFNFYSYLFSTVVIFIAYLVLRRGEKGSVSVFKTGAAKKVFVFVAIMAVMLFVNSYFKTLAAAKLDAVLLYPLNQGLTLISSVVMASVVFKEKATLRCLVGVAVAFVSLLIINLI